MSRRLVGAWVLVLGVLVGVSGALVAQDPLRGGSVEFGTLAAQPGETVKIPVFSGQESPVRGVHIVFTYDAARLKYLGFDVKDSEARELDPLALRYVTRLTGEGTCGFGETRVDTESFRIPPGPRRHIGNLSFYVLATANVGAAAVTPQERIPSIAGATEFAVDLSAVGGLPFASIYPNTFVKGGVEVISPPGPRPVGNLVCGQLLDRVQLAFSLSEAYDVIEVAEDGITVASLPGLATAWEGPLQSVGVHRYDVVASKAGALSIPASCDLIAVTPAAPVVRGLTCHDQRLSWTNPVPAFDQILVLRDGAQIATLTGTVQSFSDPEAPTALAVYTVITELGGFRSPETSCIQNGIWTLEAGDVQVPVGTRRVAVPIYATNSGTVQGFECYMNIDTTRFTLVKDLKAALEGTVGRAEPEFFLMGISGAFAGAPALGLVYDYHAPREPEKDLPPGLRQHVVSFIFDVEGSTSEGDVFPISFVGGSFTFDSPAGAATQNVDFYLPGEIRFGSGGVAPVNGLGAQVGGGAGGGGGGKQGARDVELKWRNGGAYDAVRVERNGQLVTELSGQSTTFVDAQLAGGIYTYKVFGVVGSRRSPPRSALLSTFTPPGAFLRGDANYDGVINITDPITVLGYLFLGAKAPACPDAADTDDDGKLTIGDPIATLGVFFSGVGVIKAPGAIYPWFDPTPDELGCAGR